MTIERLNLLPIPAQRRYLQGAVLHRNLVEKSFPCPMINVKQAREYVESKDGLGQLTSKGEEKFSDAFFEKYYEVRNRNPGLLQDEDAFLILASNTLVELDAFFSSRLSLDICFAKWSVMDQILLRCQGDYLPDPYEKLAEPFSDLIGIICEQTEKPPTDFWQEVSRIRREGKIEKPIGMSTIKEVIDHFEVLWYNPTLSKCRLSYREALVKLLTDRFDSAFEGRKILKGSKAKSKVLTY